MLSAGNAVVFNAHPSAKRVSAFAVSAMNDAAVRAGGPANLICCTAEPTIESAQELMHHPTVRLLVVTGGPGVVKAAMKTGKKVIAGGPGNPPCVVDETADLAQAGEGIVKGVSLDNNIVCTAEKEIIAVASIADQLKAEMARNGAYEMNADECARVEAIVLKDGYPNKDWVGKDATKNPCGCWYPSAQRNVDCLRRSRREPSICPERDVDAGDRLGASSGCDGSHCDGGSM